ncbi:hypothetical protein H6B14_04570 [Phocaeicola coprophilus]|nr:hypothetical protein [Phocaeicola coprophilus]
MKKRQNIFIHPDRIEHLDETNARLEQGRKPAVATGYKSICCVRNSRRHRDILLRRDFVREKCPSGVFIIFKVVDRREVMLQPVPVEFINRTSICHIARRPFPWLRGYAYRAELDRTPEPAMVLLHSGVDPLLPEYTFELEEYRVQDAAFGELTAYKLIPFKMG